MSGPVPSTTPPAAPPPMQPPQPGTTTGPSGPRAGFWRRFVAVLVDGLLLGIGQAVINVAFGGDPFGFEYGYIPSPGEPVANVNPIANILNLALQVGYYTYFEGAAAGQTLGKKLLGIRVIDFRTGGPLGYGTAALRWLCRILSGIPCGLGYFWMLWDKEKQTWHDKLTNTVVVPTSSYPVEKWPG